LAGSYWVKSSVDRFEIKVRGAIPTSTAINLKKGWNLIGFPSVGAQDTTAVFKALSDKNIIDRIIGNGKFYTFDSNAIYNSLVSIKPGVGYWLKMNAADVLTVTSVAAAGDGNSGGRARGKAGGQAMLDQFERQLVAYPSTPAIVMARLVSRGYIPGGSLAGAFVDDELRGVQFVKRVDGESTVALVVHVEQQEKVGFKLWNGTVQAWQSINESLILAPGDVHGSVSEAVLLTQDAEPLIRGLVLAQDTLHLVVEPELLGAHKLQRSTDLIYWEDVPITWKERISGVMIDPDQPHGFYRLIER